MKKGIIITILIMSIITCNKVKAEITDFHILGSNSIFNTYYKEFEFTSNDGNAVIYHDYTFDNNLNITDTRQTHSVFTYTSYYYHWDQGNLNNGSGSIYDNEMGDFQPKIKLYDTDGNANICQMNSGLIVCPVAYNTTYNKIRVELMLHASQTSPASYTNYYVSIFNLEYNVITSLDWFENGFVYYMRELRDAINNNFNNAINNQTEQILESNQICNVYDKNAIIEQNKYINTNGQAITTTATYGVTDYIKIDENTKITYLDGYTTQYSNICFYNINKTKITCIQYNTNLNNTILSIPTGTSYFRATINYETNKPQLKVCRNGNQALIDSNYTYDQNATQDYTNQTEEMDNITNAEDTLMNNLDFNTTDMNITINPNASTFIWNIVDSLRLMSTKIVLLMTSIMSLGIIKLVLNR